MKRISGAGLVRNSCIFLLGCMCAVAALAQDPPIPQLKPRSERKAAEPAIIEAPAAVPQTIALTVPKGTPMQVALDQEVRVRKVGQPIHGRLVEPVYAFDKLVLPVGTEVLGRVTKIGDISKAKRTEAVLNADFTPVRKVEMEFNQLLPKDAQPISLETTVSPGSGQVLKFTTATEKKKHDQRSSRRQNQ